jgi:hypothetical protein
MLMPQNDEKVLKYPKMKALDRSKDNTNEAMNPSSDAALSLSTMNNPNQSISNVPPRLEALADNLILDSRTDRMTAKRCRDVAWDDSGDIIQDWRVLVSSNTAFEDVFLNWYKSFTKLGLHHEMPLTLVADDEELYNKYQNSTKMIVKKGWEANNTKFAHSSLTGDLKFGEEDYKHLVSRRPSFLLEELELGNVLYMDIDVVLVQDPRRFFRGHQYDFWGQKHKDVPRTDSGPHRCKPTFCTGFLALRNTARTKAAMQLWKERLEISDNGRLNQGTFNNQVLFKIEDLNARSLPLALFPTRRQYRTMGQEKRDEVVILHNNYCRGAGCKKELLEKYGLWDPATFEDLVQIAQQS